MEVEHSVKTFELDASLEANINRMTAEGWMLIPGVPPVGIYHVVRMKNVQVGETPGVHKPVAKLSIDESKMFTLRDGKYLDHEGKEVDPSVINGGG